MSTSDDDPTRRLEGAPDSPRERTAKGGAGPARLRKGPVKRKMVLKPKSAMQSAPPQGANSPAAEPAKPKPVAPTEPVAAPTPPAPPEPVEPPEPVTVPEPQAAAPEPDLPLVLEILAPREPFKAPTVEVKQDPAEWARAITQAVADDVLARLQAVLESPGRAARGLTSADLEAFRQRLASDTDDVAAGLELALGTFSEAQSRAREEAKLDKIRQFPFDRLIVKTFSHLFASEEELARGGAALSRRMLPGFFMAMGMMVGPEVLEEYQEKCRRIVLRLRHRLGTKYNLNALYADPNTKPLMMDALVKVALCFEDLDKRRDWMIDLINSNLARPDPNRGEGKFAAAWIMTPASFHALLNALMVPLRERLEVIETRTDLMMDYGKGTVDRVEQVLLALDQAEDRIARAG